MTPTQRTLKAQRDMGRLCDMVERFNPYGGEFGTRHDLFGFIDIIAVDCKEGIIGVQSCGQAFSEHVHKMTEECHQKMYLWLRCAKVELWGWRKVKLKRGGKAERWKPRVMDFWLESNIILWKERENGEQV